MSKKLFASFSEFFLNLLLNNWEKIMRLTDVLKEELIKIPLSGKTRDECIKELIDKLDSGDIIIYDGALKADIALPDKLLTNITKKANEKEVILVGLSKRSTLYSNHVPITYFVKKYGDKLYPKEKWFFEVSNVKKSHMFSKTFIVKFNPISNFVFRTDIDIFEKEEPRNIFGKISNL